MAFKSSKVLIDRGSVKPIGMKNVGIASSS